MSERQQAYQNKLNELSLLGSSYDVATNLARGLWNGKTNAKNANVDEMTTAIKNAGLNLNDDYIQSIIKNIIAGG